MPGSADEQRRRRELDRVFGDVLPDQTRDDVEPQDDSSADEWLRRQVPPHHGG